MSEAAFAALVDKWRVDEREPTPIERAQAGLSGLACRKATAPAVAVEAAPTSSSNGAVANSGDETQVRTVKLSTNINQMLDNEVAVKALNTTQFRMNWEIVHSKNGKPLKMKKPNDVQMYCSCGSIGSRRIKN